MSKSKKNRRSFEKTKTVNAVSGNQDVVNGSDSKKKEQSITCFEIVKFVIEFIVGVATVATVIVAWKTLEEMQIERDSAFRPEIVIAPSSFEGRKVETEEIDPMKKHIYINYNALLPSKVYYEGIPDEDEFICLEAPFLIMKNIGAGTAKDIHVTFSLEWLEKTVELLNNEPHDANVYSYRIDNSLGATSFHVSYVNSNESNDYDSTLVWGDERSSSITYIKSDDDSVDVELPDAWYKLLAVLYNQQIKYYSPRTYIKRVTKIMDIPDLVISIKYSDIQGKVYEYKDIVIPWTCCFEYLREGTKDEEMKTIHLWSSFYEGYVR